MKAISDFFAAVQGKSWGWRFRNWREYQCINEPISGFTGGTTMQLTRLRTLAAGGVQETVIIKKPDLVLPITLTRDGTAFPSSGNWTLPKIDWTLSSITLNDTVSILEAFSS